MRTSSLDYDLFTNEITSRDFLWSHKMMSFRQVGYKKKKGVNREQIVSAHYTGRIQYTAVILEVML